MLEISIVWNFIIHYMEAELIDDYKSPLPLGHEKVL